MGVRNISYGFTAAVFVYDQLRSELPEGILFGEVRAGGKAVYDGGIEDSLPVADRGGQQPGGAGGAR